MLWPDNEEKLQENNFLQIRFNAPFKYSSLSDPNCIRLLRLHEGSETDVIVCDLFEAQLGQHLPFEALSYTWDLHKFIELRQRGRVDFEKSRPHRPIMINGKSHLITMNLYHAFFRIPSPKEEAAYMD